MSSIFIKPNITSLLNHLYNEFNKFYCTQYKRFKTHTYIEFIEFCWTQYKRFECTHTSLLKFNQACSKGGQWGQLPPQLKKMRQNFSGYWSFWYINQRNTSVQVNVTVKKHILLQFLVEPDQNSMVY